MENGLKFKRGKRDGQDVVLVQQELVVQVPLLRQNLAQFTAERDAAQAKIDETRAMLAQVEKLAPDLLAASDRAQGLDPMPKRQPSRQQKRAANRKSGKRKRAS